MGTHDGSLTFLVEHKEKMSDKEYVKSLIKEAELYRKQGLLAQSKGTFEKVLSFARKSKSLSGRDDLIKAVDKKIHGIENGLKELTVDSDMPELSTKEQGLIRNLFSFSKNKNTAAMESALALAKFGQYESALAEFNKLLNSGIMPLASAKNILRCHLALSSPSEAIDQYERWINNQTLGAKSLEKVRSFLAVMLDRKGVKVSLPSVNDRKKKEESTLSTESKNESEVLDISSVGVRIKSGSEKGKRIEFDVTFQSGNIISIVLSSKEKSLLDVFKIGIVLPDMQFYSPIAIFRGKGIISGKTEIKSGPKKGDYMLDIRVESG